MAKKVTPAKPQPVAVPLISSEPSQPAKWFPWLLFGLACALYLNTLQHQWAFDDFLVIQGNEFTQKGAAGIKDLVSQDFFNGVYGKEGGMELSGGRYRPLSLVMFALERQFFGDTPLPGHALNILFYGLTAIMLFRVLCQWFGETNAVPYIASLLFIAHPIHTEVVANIKSRDEIMAFLLLLVCLWALWKSLDERTGFWTGISVGSYFLALLAKESAFMYVPIFPFLLMIFGKQASFREAAIKSAPLWITAIGYYALRTAIVGSVSTVELNKDIMENPFVNSGFAERFGTISVILLKYLGLMVWPWPLSCDYSFAQIPFRTFSDPLAILGALLHLGALGYAAVKIWKGDLIALCIIMYFLPLFPTTNIVFNIGAPMGERFLYLPSFGLCILAAWGLAKLLKAEEWDVFKKSFLGLGALGVVVLAFAALTIKRNPDWYENMTLFEKDVQTSANSAKMQFYYGNALVVKYMAQPEKLKDKTLLAKAEVHLKKSFEINPKFHHAAYELGNCYDQAENGAEAKKWLEKTIALAPTHIKSHLMLGKVYGRYLNDADNSIKYLERYVNEYKQENSLGYQFLGTAYAIKGRLNEAETMLLKSIKMTPDNAESHQNLAVVYQQMADVAARNGDAAGQAKFLERSKTMGDKAASLRR